MVLLTVGALLAIIAAVLTLTGRIGFVATHGVSMHPLYHDGDLVIVARAPSYHVGQIVAYHLGDNHTVVLHRIIGGNPTGFIIKGDNNQSIDPHRSSAARIVGHAVLHIPQAGRWLHQLTTPPALAVAGLLILAAGGNTTRRRRHRKEPMSRHASPTRLSPARVASLPPALRSFAVTAAVAGIIGLGLAVMAFSRPLYTSTASVAPATGRLTFAYSAPVGRTPAYDSTTATSPDPIFRKVTNHVDVLIDYQGHPGTMAVTAALDATGGWHSTIALAPDQDITSNHRQITIPLDLIAMENRSKAAATLTGLPATPLRVVITATMHTTGRPDFRATLPLRLDPLTLSMVGDPKSLTVTEPSTAGPTRAVPAHLDIATWHLQTGTARWTAIGLLAASLLMALLLLALARRLAPATDGAAIRQRYSHLLVPIRPPAGTPHTVDVTDMTTLVRLAEHYGLLVLHWSQSEIDTFIVRDDDTTYRYRTGICQGG